MFSLWEEREKKRSSVSAAALAVSVSRYGFAGDEQPDNLPSPGTARNCHLCLEDGRQNRSRKSVFGAFILEKVQDDPRLG